MTQSLKHSIHAVFSPENYLQYLLTEDDKLPYTCRLCKGVKLPRKDKLCYTCWIAKKVVDNSSERAQTLLDEQKEPTA